MKHFSLPFLLAALLAAAPSCSKQSVLPPAPEPAGATAGTGASGTLLVTLGQDGTKAALGGLDEKAVRCLQVFVFNEAGTKETDKFVSASSLTITSPVGRKHIWAIVNHSRFADIAKEEDLKKTVTDLSENYTSGDGIRLVMAGEKDVEVTQASEQVIVNVTRLASRILLKSVKRVFSDTYLTGRSFTIKDIYLKNVAGNTNFSLDKKNNGLDWDIVDPTTWYNMLKDSETATVSPLLCSHGLSIACEEATAKEINQVFYTYPNPTSGDNTGSSWCARHTRLVVHAEITGGGSGTVQSYYTFTLPVLKRNCSYEITDITFTMLGKDNDGDDSVTDTGAAAITLKVLDWDTPTELTYDR